MTGRAAAALARYRDRLAESPEAVLPDPEPVAPIAAPPPVTVGRCIMCDVKLVTEREAVRCEPCQAQAAGRWPGDGGTDAAILARLMVDAPRHHSSPDWTDVPTAPRRQPAEVGA